MISQRINIPDALYRLQFNRSFTFGDAVELVPYLYELGISHLYASPFLKARPGSSHGYDIVDHNRINPEIGDFGSFKVLVDRLHEQGLGLILDFVPNHMGVGGCDNEWWLDILENGEASVYAHYFDIDWKPAKTELHGKVLLPVLGDYYGNIVDNGKLRLSFDEKKGSFTVNYYEHCFPIDPSTYPMIFSPSLPDDTLITRSGKISARINRLVERFHAVPPRTATDTESKLKRREKVCELKENFSGLCREFPDVKKIIQRKVNHLNGESGLHGLLEAQAYRLAYWRVASDEINYRRFFNINSLAGVRVEAPEVFDHVHRLVLGMISNGSVNGLRIDHPDGLFDPVAYLEKLVNRIDGYLDATGGVNVGDEFYLVIEKILAPFENLPDGWPVAGTTGYDFLSQLNGIFVYGPAEKKMTSAYSNFVGRRLNFDELLYQAKKLVTTKLLSSELTVLTNRINRISELDPHTRDYTLNGLRTALIELVASFPIYRTYLNSDGYSKVDEQYIDWAVSQAKKWNPESEVSIFDFLRQVLLNQEGGGTHHRDLKRPFAMKLQQYTAPVMAKSLEDTVFYRYNRLVSLNEVGGDPGSFGLSLAGFHQLNRQRRRYWPRTMLTTSTHDTKRSEDVRARINVLSELADEWSDRVRYWAGLNRSRKSRLNTRLVPFRNDEYMLYQNLVGVWPFEPPGGKGYDIFMERLVVFFRKAIRESKENSSWLNPNAEYEEAAEHFLRNIINPAISQDFLADFLPFQERVAFFGIFKSLSQLVLKLTSPGVPDIYQGNEMWDFSLVDPDNRRAVDFLTRRKAFVGLNNDFPGGKRPPNKLAELIENPYDGRVKLFVTWRCLQFRKRLPALFNRGTYLPLSVSGRYGEHVCAFARVSANSLAIVAVPRFPALLTKAIKIPPLSDIWDDTVIDLTSVPKEGRLLNEFTGETLKPEASGHLPVKEVFSRFPVALFERI